MWKKTFNLLIIISNFVYNKYFVIINFFLFLKNSYLIKKKKKKKKILKKKINNYYNRKNEINTHLIKNFSPYKDYSDSWIVSKWFLSKFENI